MLSRGKAYTAPTWAMGSATWCGLTVESARRAIDWHDRGRFVESYAAAEKVTRWSRIFGALDQRIAPVLRLPRAVEGGLEGLDGIVRAEAESFFVGEATELGAAFPSFWGTIWRHAMMGFCWWQTTFVPSPDGSTEIPKTSIFPCEATQYDEGRKTWVAFTVEESAIDIDPEDDRWTLVADGDRPWLSGAIRALCPDYVEAMFTKDDRADLSDTHGRPKPIGVLPDGVATEAPEGKAAFETLKIIHESDAGGIFPNGMTVFQLPPSAETAQLMKDILEDDAIGVAITLLGTDGTMSKGTGGVYTAPVFQGVAESRVAADVTVTVRAANRVIERWRRRNYASAKTPRAVIRMPNTNRDAAAAALAKRLLDLHMIMKVARENGCPLTQEQIAALSRPDQLDVPAPILVPGAAPAPASGPPRP